MNIAVGPYRFEIALVKKKCRRLAYRRKVLLACELTLGSIPHSVFRRYLRPSVLYGLNLVFVDPTEIKRLNTLFRGKKKPTDVLSFSQIEAGKFPGKVLELGDIVICVEVARENAFDDKIPLSNEVQKLTIHGILHLFGYDHERTKSQARRMFRLQDSILASCLRRLPK